MLPTQPGPLLSAQQLPTERDYSSEVRNTSTNASGLYSFVSLLPVPYTITISYYPEFKTEVLTHRQILGARLWMFSLRSVQLRTRSGFCGWLGADQSVTR